MKTKGFLIVANTTNVEKILHEPVFNNRSLVEPKNTNSNVATGKSCYFIAKIRKNEKYKEYYNILFLFLGNILRGEKYNC